MNQERRLLSSHVTRPLSVTGIHVGLALMAVYVIWGSTYLAVRIAQESFPPLLLSSFRFLLAGGLLYFILRVRGIPAPSPRQWVWATIIGGFLFAICQGGVAFAQQLVSSSFAATWNRNYPLVDHPVSGHLASMAKATRVVRTLDRIRGSSPPEFRWSISS